MIDIVLLVLKIGILVLLYLFIWQVVKTAVATRARARRRGGRARRRAARRARARWPCSRRPSARRAARSALTERTMAGEKLDFTGHIDPRLDRRAEPHRAGRRRVPAERLGHGRPRLRRATSCSTSTSSRARTRASCRAAPFYYVEDLGSTNGTFVNEKQVSGEAQLKLDSRVRIGETVFRYEE